MPGQHEGEYGQTTGEEKKGMMDKIKDKIPGMHWTPLFSSPSYLMNK